MIKTWKPGDFERPCGDCKMCCKLPAVPEIDKKPWEWCQHCPKGKGCQIYEDRPQGCRDFMCLWKVMPDFPEDQRPDRCKVIWQLTQDGRFAIAMTEYPKALETSAQRRIVEAFTRQGIPVIITNP